MGWFFQNLENGFSVAKKHLSLLFPPRPTLLMAEGTLGPSPRDFGVFALSRLLSWC